MPDIDFIRREIERMRAQVHRQRGEIRQLQRAGIPTNSAETLLDRMLNKVDELAPSVTGSSAQPTTAPTAEHTDLIGPYGTSSNWFREG